MGSEHRCEVGTDGKWAHGRSGHRGTTLSSLDFSFDFLESLGLSTSPSQCRVLPASEQKISKLAPDAGLRSGTQDRK